MPGPRPPFCTASDGKLGGTRLTNGTPRMCKCKTMLTTIERNSVQFCLILFTLSYLIGSIFSTSSSYLGVSISCNLCWSACFGHCGKRKFYRLCNTSTLRKLFSNRDCSHVWDPFLQKDIELLESVQKFAVRVCTKRWREPLIQPTEELYCPM